MKLDIYNGKDLQRFLAILTQFEAQHGTDIRFLREQIYNHVHNELLKDKQTKTFREGHKERKKMHEKMPLCPSCGKGRLEPVMNYEGEKIMGCKKCRYSTIQE